MVWECLLRRTSRASIITIGVAALMSTPTVKSTSDIHSMLGQCWPTVCDAGPTLSQYTVFAGNSVNTGRWAGVGLILSHRLQRWPNISTALVYCLEFNVGALDTTVKKWVNQTCPPPQHTRHFETMSALCWSTVCDAGPTLSQHCFNVSCLLGLFVK